MKLNYGMTKTLSGASLDVAVERVTSALKEQGFGVLTTIDVQSTFRAKLGDEFRPYVILGACNPKLARAALKHDPHLGLLLPCNVVVQQLENDQIMVSMINANEMFQVAGDSELAPIASEVNARLSRALDAVAT